MGPLHHQGDLFLGLPLQSSLCGGQLLNLLDLEQRPPLLIPMLIRLSASIRCHLFFEEFQLHFIEGLPVLLLSSLHGIFKLADTNTSGQ